MKITVKNNRDHNLSLAFRWAGFDLPDDRRSGWYIVPSGESKTFTFKDAYYPMTAEGFGYYATGGEKVWAGKSGDEHMAVIIHPKNKFSGHPDDPISGGKKVVFRRVALKETDDGTRENATATLTFNP